MSDPILIVSYVEDREPSPRGVGMRNVGIIGHTDVGKTTLAERMNTVKSNDTPPMPQSQEEWEAHWAFYRLTVQQRDQAWTEVRTLREALEQIASRAPSVKSRNPVAARSRAVPN